MKGKQEERRQKSCILKKPKLNLNCMYNLGDMNTVILNLSLKTSTWTLLK